MPLKPPMPGLDWSVTHNYVITPGAGVWTVANNAKYIRAQGRGLISKVAIYVAVASGNISVGVYAGSGSGQLRVPAARLATTGAVTCPTGTSGYAEIALDGSVYVNEGDFYAISCDNTTASFLGSTGVDSNLFKGISYTQATAHALPTNAGTLASSTYRMPIIVGIA